MPEYREAKCIELHDSNIALTTYDESYCSGAPTGRTEYAEKPAFSVKFCDIKLLAQMFGYDTEKYIDVPILSNQSSARSGERTEIDHVEFPVYKVHYDYTNDRSASSEKITKLECEIISDRLVNIRTTSTSEEDQEPYIEEITYSGAFTIWWVRP